MKYDELAFANQQLSSMLRDGLPLEGSLRQLCATMQKGHLKTELEALEQDLSRGAPLAEALSRRRLPPLYVQMLQAGAKSNDLPGILILLADYYQKTHSIWTRLKALMVYPTMVFAMAMAVSLGVAFISHQLADLLGDLSREVAEGMNVPSLLSNLYVVPLVLVGLGLLFVLVLYLPAGRQFLRWRAPGFKEASLSQFAAVMQLLLKGGCTLRDAVALLRRLEATSPMALELLVWQERLEAGHSRFMDIAYPGKLIPPLFVWLVASAREDLPLGFKRASDIYSSRALYRVDLILYAIGPASIILLGVVIIGQFWPVFSTIIRTITVMGS